MAGVWRGRSSTRNHSGRHSGGTKGNTKKSSKPDYVTLFEWDSTLIEEAPHGFLLHPNQTGLSDQGKLAAVFQRQTAFDQQFQATFDCRQLTDGQAGLTVFLNATHHYEGYLEKRRPVSS